LSKVLSDGFQEGVKKDLRAGFPEDQDDYADDYDYSSDSDLECPNDEETTAEGSVSAEENRSSSDGSDDSGKVKIVSAESRVEADEERFG
jgi:hypothetical protein